MPRGAGNIAPIGRIIIPQRPFGAAGNLLGQTVVAGPDGILLFGGWDGKAPTAGSAYLPLR